MNVLEFLRSSVRPVLTYLFSVIFAIAAIVGFFKFGTAEMAQGLMTALVGISGVIAGFYYQSRNQNNTPGSESKK